MTEMQKVLPKVCVPMTFEMPRERPSDIQPATKVMVLVFPRLSLLFAICMVSTVAPTMASDFWYNLEPLQKEAFRRSRLDPDFAETYKDVPPGFWDDLPGSPPRAKPTNPREPPRWFWDLAAWTPI